MDVLRTTTMPAKRRYGESLTGGTGDVNPQSYTLSFPLPVGAANSIVGFPLPIPRYPGTSTRAVVMEVLEVEWFINGTVIPSPGAGDNYNITCGLTTASLAPASALDIVKDPKTISAFRRSWRTLNATAVGFAIFSPDQEESDDLTDRAGHGFLVATDNIYIQYNQGVGNYTAPSEIVCKLNYRMKEVGLTEYIGIVQSQQ